MSGEARSAMNRTTTLPASEDGAPRSERARHDQHVRTMRAWVTEGELPPGLGVRLRQWRKVGRGWTVEQLAAKTGFDVPTLLRMERGRQHIPMEAYRKLVTALAVDPLTVRNAMAPLEAAKQLATVRMPSRSAMK